MPLILAKFGGEFCCLSVALNGVFEMLEISVRSRPESVSKVDRNECPRSTGIGVRGTPEYAVSSLMLILGCFTN